MKNCTSLWREAHFQVQMYKTHQARTTFGSWGVEKLHGAVARSTFANQIVQNTPGPDHFWKLGCGKIARRCGAKHICKSNCTKHTRPGPLLEVGMWKNCTSLWREAHLQIKLYKTHQARTTFGSWDVEKLHGAVARSTFANQIVQNTPGPDHFWKLGCGKIARRCGAKRIFKSKCTKHTRPGPLLEVGMWKNCTALWREAHLQIKLYKTHQARTTFGSWDVEKLHVAVARSAFSSPNVQNTPGPDHFWKLGCGKIARRCGAKHICKSNCTKHTRPGPLLEVGMWKNCTALWREAHLQIKLYKTHQARTTFGSWDVEKLHVAVARSAFSSPNVQNTPGPDHFWKLGCGKIARRCGAKHICKSNCTKHTRPGPLLEVGMWKNCTALWREAHLQIKLYKTHQARTTFGSWDVEKLHGAVARSTFANQIVQNTPGPDHFWKLGCGKIARRCGAKRICKSNCTKHTRPGPLLEVGMWKNCTALWREAHLQIKLYKTHQARTTFGSWDVEKLHGAVARSTFANQIVQNTPGPDHFWKLGCGKIARRCGAKHICKSNCTKHTRPGPLLEVGMWKNCTALWREAHLQIKLYKTHQARTTFGSWDVEKLHGAVARSTFANQIVQNTPGPDHFWKLGCGKIARRCGAKHICKSNCTKHTRPGPLLEVGMWKNCTALWREAHLQIKLYKTHQARTTFGSWDVEKLHGAVVRSTFANQIVQNTPGPDHFWKLGCGKIARRCGAKHICKSNCTKHTRPGPLLEVGKWKNCTALWREAHLQIKLYKTHQARTTFGSWDVEKLHGAGAKHICKSNCTKHTRPGPLLAVGLWKNCTALWREAHLQIKLYKTHQARTTFGSWEVEKLHGPVARSTFANQIVQNTPGPDHFWKLGCGKIARRCGAKHICKSNCTKPDHFWKLGCGKIARRCGAKHICKSNCTKHTRPGPLLEVGMWKNCTALWREAHLQIKLYKTHQARTTFGSWDVEKLHGAVARSTLANQIVQNTPGPDHFWKLGCGKIARRCGAQHICKSNCTKHTRPGPLLEVGMWKNCTALWREAHLQIKLYKTHQARTTFGSWDVEKLHGAVARSTFANQIVQNTRGPDHFWKLGCGKIARRCGAKHICKSNCTKHTRPGPLLEVGMSKNCTALWREAHLQIKLYKTHQARTTFGSWDVEKWHGAVARSTFANQIVQNTPASDQFLKFRCGKMARRCSENRICKSKCRKHTMFGALFEVRVSKICTPLARSTFASQKYKTPAFRNIFGGSDVEKVSDR